jgi:hypothetical protein
MSNDSVTTTKAKFNGKQVELALSGLANLRGIVRGFFHVKNPVGQFFQRYFAEVLESRIKVAGRKSPIRVTIPRLWCVAVDPANNRRVKGAGSKFLKALAARHVSEANAIPLASEILTYVAAKLITSQDQKFEGALMAQAFNHLETECGITLESLSVGDNSYTREAMESKRDNQLKYLQVLIDAGIAPEFTRQSVANVEDGVPLL